MATAPSIKTSAGRGRGRARSSTSSLNNPGGNGHEFKKYVPILSSTEPKVVKYVDTFKPVEESLELCLRKATPENLQSCLSKADEFAITDEKIKKVVSSLFEKCLQERRLAANGGQVAATLISSEKIGPTFRNMFLKKFQETYTNRDKQRKTDFDKYLCFSVFLCSIFKDVRVNGEVMKILTKPVFNMLGELLDGKNVEVSQTEKGMEIFRDNLSMIASLLQAADKGQMDELFKKVRSNIIKETSHKISCILLETFEYYSSDDWTPKDETKDFYSSLMADITAKS